MCVAAGARVAVVPVLIVGETLTFAGQDRAGRSRVREYAPRMHNPRGNQRQDWPDEVTHRGCVYGAPALTANFVPILA